MHEVTVEGLRIVYERAGHGPPLVLLHGALSDARAWRRQAEALAGELTVIAWDAPACGRSDDPPEPWAMADWARVLAGFLDALGLGPAHVLGLSWGGSIALELYRRAPEAVASLVLADTYAGWKGSLSPELCAQRLEMALQTSRMPVDELIAQWLPQLLTEDASPELTRELTAVMADSRPSGLRLLAHAMAESDLSDVLATIAVPTLLLWGERDERSPLSIADGMLAAIPHAELVVIPDAGHESNIEQPERFSAAVREFCRRAGSAAIESA